MALYIPSADLPRACPSSGRLGPRPLNHLGIDGGFGVYSLSGHVYKDVEIKLSIGCSVAWGCCCFRFIFIFSRVLRVSGDFMAFCFEGGGV